MRVDLKNKGAKLSNDTSRNICDNITNTTGVINSVQKQNEEISHTLKKQCIQLKFQVRTGCGNTTDKFIFLQTHKLMTILPLCHTNKSFPTQLCPIFILQVCLNVFLFSFHYISNLLVEKDSDCSHDCSNFCPLIFSCGRRNINCLTSSLSSYSNRIIFFHLMM